MIRFIIQTYRNKYSENLDPQLKLVLIQFYLFTDLLSLKGTFYAI